MAEKTPRLKENGLHSAGSGKSSPTWEDISLSPTPSWTPAPPALKLSEDEDDQSPSSIRSVLATPAHKYFSFASPRPTEKRSHFLTASTPKSYSSYSNIPKQHGFLSSEPRLSRKTKIVSLVLFTFFLLYGAFCWDSLQQKSSGPMSVVPPPTSLSALAKEAFAKNYARDWGAEPPLWVILDASSLSSHSFTDDSSMVYYEGKHYQMGLEEFLLAKYSCTNGHERSSAVKITSYYSLQDQGLDYIARNMVTPDGSKTMLQIQYLPYELDACGNDVAQLKETILQYGRDNAPSFLEIHYTGPTWNPKMKQGTFLKAILFAAILSIVGIVLSTHFYGLEHPATLWAMVAMTSMAATSALSSVLICLVGGSSNSMALSTMLLVSFLLSIYFSKIQVDGNTQYKTMGESMLLQSGVVLVTFFASFYILPSPTLHTVGLTSMIAVISSLIFHAVVVPQFWDHLPYARSELNRVCPSPSMKKAPLSKTTDGNNHSSLTSTVLCVIFMLPVAFQSRHVGLFSLDGMAPSGLLFDDAPNELFKLGESVGHGKLTPYRILFDGHKSNISMISLNGYDIVQLVVDELVGISIPDGDSGTEDDFDPNEINLESLQGSTHVGEAYTEVQHMIKEFVDMLRQFKERQQEEFDWHHHRRRNLQQREDSDSQDTRCNYNFNSGIRATSYTGLSVLENSRIPQALYSAAKVCRGMEPRCPSEALHLLNKLEDETTTPDHLSAYVTVVLGVDPFSAKGTEWLRLARETIERLQKDPRVLGGVEMHIDGYAAFLEDFKSHQRQALPGRLYVVAGILFVALSIACRSFLVALNVIVTTGLTLATSVGAGVLVYTDGVLNWTRLDAFSSKSESTGISSFATVVTSIMIAMVAVLSATSLAQHRESSRTTAASGKVLLCSATFLIIWSIYAGADSPQWTLPLSVGLVLDVYFTRKLPFGPSKLWSMIGQKRGKTGELVADMTQRRTMNDDYLKKYEEFVRSPRAP